MEGVSEPTSLDASRALTVGLPDVDPQTALVFITLVLNAGAAALGFFKALREQLNVRGSVVAVSEPASGKPLGRLEGGTSDEMLEKLVSS